MPPDGIESVGEHIKLEISIYLEAFSPPERDIRSRIFNYLLNREACISGCESMDEIDLMEIGGYTELPGGNIILPGGYSSILAPLTKDISPEKILKNHTVTKVSWKKTHNDNPGNKNTEEEASLPVNLNIDPNKKHLVEVICENGKIFKTESVICTIPLGVLKEKGEVIFDPPLPSYKMDAIKRLGFGVVDKIFLEYERPFLNSDLTEVIFLWDPINKREPMSERWYKRIYSFAKVTETMLLGWVCGEEAKYMETLPFDVVSEQCTDILRKFLNDPYVPKPKRCIW